MADFIPAREAEFVTWVTNVKVQLAATPATWGVSVSQATSLTGFFDVYMPLYTDCANPATRTPAKIQGKIDARKALTAYVRQLAAQINAWEGITNDLRVQLGLAPRTDTRTPIPVPDEKPRLDIVSVVGRVITVRLHDGSPKRAKPDQVATATVYSFVGETAPDETGSWKQEGMTGRTTFDISFSPTLQPGSTVYLAACWNNAKGQSGLACDPVAVTFGSANINNNGTLKLAA